jgi:hypothetical protein
MEKRLPIPFFGNMESEFQCVDLERGTNRWTY